MTRTIALIVLVAATVAIGATPSGNPYHGIVDRNVFSLKDMPPPTPAVDPDANKPAPPLTLTGITTILGSKRAFLTLQLPGDPKTKEPGKTDSLMLSEGQRDGEVEVLQIDEKAGTVKVNSYGSITNLSFEKNGVKSASSNGTGAVANAGAAPHPGLFSAGGNLAARTIPNRLMRNSGGGTTPVGGAGNSGGNASNFTPGATDAGLNGFAPGMTPPPQQQPETQFTPQQREILLEGNYQQDLKNNPTKAAVYPPSFLNPERNRTPTPGQQPPGAPGQPPRGL